uniref:RND family efflux transporter MFP subunit n=1 Tax=uncultured bacterium CSLC2 TaxID=1091571 RepID=Q8KP07_9BACT|nr:RND family efflux transporter MFP subunit [uncultured bacterium CSLC2]
MNRVIITTCIACVVVAGGLGMIYYYVQAEQSQSVLVPFTVTERHLTSEVRISGSSKASETVDLAFKNSGIIDSVPVTVGQLVSTGTILMSLQSKTFKDRLSQARAAHNAQLATLQHIQDGTRPEQIAVSEAQLVAAETARENARHGLLAALGSAQSASDIAVRFTIDNQFITNPIQYNSVLTLTTSDSLLEADILSIRRQIQPSLASWSKRMLVLQSADVDTLLAAGVDMHAYLQHIARILDGLTQILTLNNATEFSSTEVAVASARATISSTDVALTAARGDLQNAQNAVTIQDRQLGLEKAGPTSAIALAQQAVVAGAQAYVAELHDELDDQSVAAPFTGIVTNIVAKRGEAAVAGTVAVSMISRGALKVEGYVPEVHYREITVGDPVRIELDAFPGQSFSGTLGLIDPAATLRDGVPNFKVTVYFINPDPRIRPGLTASGSIETADMPAVLSMPLAAVTGVGDTATVLRRVGGATIRTPVTLGVTGTDGFVEIVSGLKKGDVVLVNETKQYRIVPN